MSNLAKALSPAPGGSPPERARDTGTACPRGPDCGQGALWAQSSLLISLATLRQEKK